MNKQNLNKLADLALNAIKLKMECNHLAWILIDAENYAEQRAISHLEFELDHLSTLFDQALKIFVTFAVKHCMSQKQAMQLFNDACLDSYQHANGGELPTPPSYDGISYFPIPVDADHFRTFIMKHAPSPASEFAQFSLFLSTIGAQRQSVTPSCKKTGHETPEQVDVPAFYL